MRPFFRATRWKFRPGGHSSRGFISGPKNVPISDNQKGTIYALSTPPGKAGIAVIRISGPDALLVRQQMVKSAAKSAKPEPWKLHRCRIVHPETSETLDSALAVYFPGPKTFTTEDVLEMHVHSGRAVISAVLGGLSRLPYCRPAEAGEFTERAFRGGRLDLTEVEGLKDLIDADTEIQRRAALRSAEGTVRGHFEELRTEVLHCLAFVEALIDFGEGEDIEEGVYDQARSRAQKLLTTIESHLNDQRRGEIVRTGVRLAIFGPPNAGKSSLLNFLAQREAAIVTSVPGTTRDILDVSLDMDGVPVIVSDTAGIRDTDDLVESIGIERAVKAVESANVSLCVVSSPEVLSSRTGLPETLLPLIKPDTLFLLNKSDLANPADLEGFSSPHFRRGAWAVSLRTGAGTQAFMDGFGDTLRRRYNLLADTQTNQTPLITRARHRVHLESAAQFLRAFLDIPPGDIVLAAEELRYAARSIGKISGLIDTEDVLDAVFREFCIGK